MMFTSAMKTIASHFFEMDLITPSSRSLFTSACIGLCLILTALLGPPSHAQTASDNAGPAVVTPNTNRPDAKEDTRYRIGPGDVLSIQVLKSAELSAGVRVDQRGMIRLPMVEGEVFAACHTESELAAQLTTLYLEYKKNPVVQVFVTEFQGRPVAVIGAVEKPGQFRLQRQVKLLELVSYAGGPTDKAGRVINVIHTGGPSLCAKPETTEATTQAVAGQKDGASSLDSLGVFKLDETLTGKPGSNPFIEPGDIVSVPEADQVFVIGHVVQPRAIALKDKAITVSRAIAMAGGAARDGKTSKVRIVRDSGAGDKQEIYVDLKAIQQRRAVDVALLPNDVVEVGTSVGKTILGIVSGALPATLSNGVVRVIP
jgi:polysaccharide export outer membrane protein